MTVYERCRLALETRYGFGTAGPGSGIACKRRIIAAFFVDCYDSAGCG